MPSYKYTIDFYTQDYSRTLFPLDTNRVLVENFAPQLADYVYREITFKEKSAQKFLSQTKVYAAKSGFHLRRTVKLDPVAEFFIYDFAYRNRDSFKKSVNEDRLSFGYMFEDGKPISASISYREFKNSVRDAIGRFEYCLKFDISAYFNSIYHHDIVRWFSDVSGTEDDALFFGKFLRQTNSGRSIDCLPQGIYPAKMLGSHFLSFIDQASRIASDLMYRFMDDFYLFADDEETLISDFLQIQKMLGDKGLSINPVKTELGKVENLNIEKIVDKIKVKLLKRRRCVIAGYDGVAVEEEDVCKKLNKKEIEYLFTLLRNPHIEEEDVELVLSLMRDYGEDVLRYIPDFLRRFPNLIKNIYYFCHSIDDKRTLGELVLKFVSSAPQVSEYQLFWLAKILESYLLNVPLANRILALLYSHPNSTIISKAKILEIPDKRFGLGDLRAEHLSTGASGWLSWASAVGCKVERKSNRNHLLGYFANGSSMNELIANCVKRF